MLLLQAADLTAVTVERSLLAQACLSLPLPEDVVFNGHYYMDFSGNTFKVSACD